VQKCLPPFGCGVRSTSTMSSCLLHSTAPGPRGTRTSTTGHGNCRNLTVRDSIKKVVQRLNATHTSLSRNVGSSTSTAIHFCCLSTSSVQERNTKIQTKKNLVHIGPHWAERVGPAPPGGVWVGVLFSSRLYYPFGKGQGQHIIRCLKNKKCENERRGQGNAGL